MSSNKGKAHKYPLPHGAGSISATELKRASTTEQLEIMRTWFFENFENPVECCPHESAEGGYSFIWGGPYDAHDQLLEFSGIVPEEIIKQLADELTDISWEWSGRPSSDDFEDISPSNDSEDQSDLPQISDKTFSQAVLSATDWTTDTIIKQIDKGNIFLNPRFQRREAWRNDRKSQFIESIILGLPVPQLVLAERKDKKGAYLVIDGKQRLLSIRQFVQLEENESDYQRLTLSSLTKLKHLNGKTFSDLMANPQFDSELTAFENHTIRTVVIRNWQDDNFLYLVFLRLNTGSLPLAPQELRQALHPGPFVNFAEEKSSESRALRGLLNLKKPDFRMRDVELLVRFYGFKNYLPEYQGNLKTFLDNICESLNTDWVKKEQLITNQFSEFEGAYSALVKIFGPRNVCKKWTKTGYQNRFNRALFDTLFFYFSERATREAAVVRATDVEQAFQLVCLDNREFLNSIEQTTKTIDAVHNRLAIWGEALSRCLGLKLRIPKLDGNRIVY